VTDTTTIGGTEIEKMVYFGGVDGSGAELARCVRLNEIQVGPYRYQRPSRASHPTPSSIRMED